MKKIATLLIAIGAFTLVNAQSRKIEEARDVINGDSRKEDRRVYEENGVRYPDRYPSSGNRSAEIDRINREYDYKIQTIRNNPALSSEEKARIIRQLEKDRDQRIRSINKTYRDRDDDDDDDRKEKKYKSNNGKHKGWTKGKGNQKKYKDRDRDDD